MLKATAVILFCSSLARGAHRRYGKHSALLLLLLLALGAGPVLAQTNCPSATYFLQNQAAVDAFPTGCDTVTGNLQIANSTDITNLTPLAALTEVGGDLYIIYNPMLTNLTGLNGLTEVGRDLEIDNNPMLTDLTGLDALTEVGGILEIVSNDALTDLTGLNGLTQVGGYLYIVNNDALTDLTGLNGLTKVGGFLWIRANDMLTDLTGLDALSEVGGTLFISDNPMLTNLTGLDALTEVGEDLRIFRNALLTDCSGVFPLLTTGTIGGAIFISDSPSLCSSADEIIATTGTIILEKRTDPTGDPTAFTFTGRVSGTLTDGETVSAPVSPGTYTATEAPTPGWDLTSIVCDDGNSTGDTGTGTATFAVEAGETVTCTYTNSLPSIDIEKATNGHDADTPPGPSIPVGSIVTWTYTVENTGVVTLSDIVVTDDQGVAVSCPASSLAVGASMTCTASGIAQAGQYANMGKATGFSPQGTQVEDSDPSHYYGQPPTGTIIIAKDSDPTGGTGFGFTDDIAAPNSFTLDDGQTKTFTGVAAGPYSVTEDFPGPTYELATLVCDDGNSTGDVASRTATINLEAGETVTCTYTNGLPANPGIIIIKKETDPAGESGSFAFSGVVNGSIEHGGKLRLDGVAPGQYTVTEDDPAGLGFTLTAIECNDGNSTVDVAARTATLQVDPGEKLKCTFTNSVSAPPPPPPGSGCPATAMITNYQPKRDHQQFVDITNVGQDAISLDDCSLISFNVRTEESIGAATVALTGPLGSMETFRVGSAGVGGVDLVWPDGVLPNKNGSLGLINGPPPPGGTLRASVQADITTALIYLNKKNVFDYEHWIDPALNAIYDCIYSSYPYTPFTSCPGVPVVARMASAEGLLEAAAAVDWAGVMAEARKAGDAAAEEEAEAVLAAGEVVPTSYALSSNYPNPFNPQTVIRFGLPESAQVRLVVYDVLGRQVQVLAEGPRAAGWHEVTFEAGTLPSGTYLYRLETPTGSYTHRMLLVK